MPFLQMLLNAPLLLTGFFIKYLFFVRKGLGRDYLEGLRRGVALCRTHPQKKVPFRMGHVPAYVRIQLELWKNLRMLVS